MTGIAAAWASRFTAYEAESHAGGICRSYYCATGSTTPLQAPPGDGGAYRFETGGGHWMFGADPVISGFLERFGVLRPYRRRAAVFFPDSGLTVPYPLQYHLSYLGKDVAEAALEEMRKAPPELPTRLSDWLAQCFGPTLTALFFGPFHEAYTAGLWKEIAPQDGFKSPVNLAMVEAGARGEVAPAGYNTAFLYPEDGLDTLAGRMAAQSPVQYRKTVSAIDLNAREVQFHDGGGTRFGSLISTLPLNRMLSLTGLALDEECAPYTSVLVLNIGAKRGPACPEEHWLYVPRSQSGFHRVGFYSNVDPDFLPNRAGDRVSLYIERAYKGGCRPSAVELQTYCESAVRELQTWGFIAEVDVLDPSWVDAAYTWSRPGSLWREQALAALAGRNAVMTGRYARWHFQGIAESVRDGLLAGVCASPRGVSGAQ
jgi:protoporphyrinogen oxidase